MTPIAVRPGDFRFATFDDGIDYGVTEFHRFPFAQQRSVDSHSLVTENRVYEIMSSVRASQRSGCKAWG